MNRFNRKRQPSLGRIAAVTAQNFDADEFIRATRPLEQRGFSVAVVSNTNGMLTGRTEAGQDVNFVPASTVGEMEFDGFCALVLPGNSHSIGDSTQAALKKFLGDGKPIIALSRDVPLLAEAASAPDIADAGVAISMNGKMFAARGDAASDEAVEVFAQALAA
ncbi:DJ-1/PfpI family protein [Hyphobacterium sp.]|uniref:DJ-1/PfpI family protein n=1 Tax=Hyphobacterium sp. TaxID=2004662 RepID=UPI003B51D546